MELNTFDLAPNFKLQDSNHKTIELYEILNTQPVMLVFYPGDFTPVCTKQLCDYRDNYEQFKSYGLQIIGISNDSTDKHSEFSKKYAFSFPLLSDPHHEIAKLYKCTTPFLFGSVSRANVIINTKKQIVYRYVEAIAITRRKSENLIEEIQKLKTKGLL